MLFRVIAYFFLYFALLYCQLAKLPTGVKVGEESVIKRPSDLYIVDVCLSFNYRMFQKLEIDLEHINKNGRSGFTIEMISHLICRLLGGKFLAPVAVKTYGIDSCEYFLIEENIFNKKYKLVFCICDDRPEAIGIITFFRIGE